MSAGDSGGLGEYSLSLLDDDLFRVMITCQGLCAETSLRPLLKYASESLECREVSVSIRSSGNFYTAASYGTDEDYDVFREHASYNAMKGGRPVLLDIKTDPRDDAGAHEKRRYACIPILLQGESDPVGVLNVSRVEGPINELFIDKLMLFSIYAGEILTKTKENLRYFEVLINTISSKDNYTGGHCRRVSGYTCMIAEGMGLPPKDVISLGKYAMVHDIGKIGIPDHVLKKEGRLTTGEFEVMKKHPDEGVRILNYEYPAVRQHHERWNGKGYNLELSGDEIDPKARILAVADAFDAITTKRPYKEDRSLRDALKEIERCAESQFDPTVTDSFLCCCYDNPERIASIMSIE